MRHLAAVALILTLGVGRLYAQQPAEGHSGDGPVKMKFSGSIISTSLSIAPDTLNHEQHLAGKGPLGPFSYRGLWADAPGSRTIGSCGDGFGPNFRLVAGGGVFRFEDGSLLTVNLREGTLCVDISDLAHPVGHLLETHQIIGGTGRFKRAAASCDGAMAEDCTLQITARLAAVLPDSDGAVKVLTSTGEIQAIVPRLAKGNERD